MHFAVPALANAEPDCDPCGQPPEVIVRNKNKKWLTLWYINVSLD